jgi:hypothetical protein
MNPNVVAIAVLCGCSASSQPKPYAATITTLVGDAPGSDVDVLSHRGDGHVIDEGLTGADGNVELQVETGGYVTAMLWWQPRPSGEDAPPLAEMPTYAITTTAPAEGSALVIHGPRHVVEPSIGTLTITTTQPTSADHYFVELGCNTFISPMLPMTVDVSSTCLGSDTILDVKITALDAAEEPIGYSAGQAALVNGSAQFTASQWSNALTPIGIDLQGITNPTPTVRLAARHDGLEIEDAVVMPTSNLSPGAEWNGLAIDGVTLRAFSAAGSVVRDVPGLPANVIIGVDDFPSWRADGACTFKIGSQQARLQWSSAPDGVDVVHCSGTIGVLGWNAVVPPQGGLVTFPIAVDPAQGFFDTGGTYLDATDADDYASAIAGDLHLETSYPSTSRIIKSATGEVRRWP